MVIVPIVALIALFTLAATGSSLVGRHDSPIGSRGPFPVALMAKPCRSRHHFSLPAVKILMHFVGESVGRLGLGELCLVELELLDDPEHLHGAFLPVTAALSRRQILLALQE